MANIFNIPGYFEQDMVSPVAGELKGGYDDDRPGGRKHRGGDLAAPAGSPVVAPGNMEFIAGKQGGKNLRENDWWAWFKDQDSGVQYRFAHIGDISHLKKGQVIPKGEQFTTIGSAVSDPHLHMSIYDPATQSHVNWLQANNLKRGQKFEQGGVFAQAGDFEKRAGKIAASTGNVFDIPGYQQEGQVADIPGYPGPKPAGAAEIGQRHPVSATWGDPNVTREKILSGEALKPPAGYAKPMLEFGGLALGEIAGVPAGPVGMAAGAGLGYGMGKRVAGAIEQFQGTRKPETLTQGLAEGAKDVATGTMMNMAGQITGAVVSPVANWISTKLAPGLYESAIKIPPSVPANIRERVVQKGIEGRYLPTKSTLTRIKGEMDVLEGDITSLINKGAKKGQMVDTNEVLKKIDVLKDYYNRLPAHRRVPIIAEIDQMKSTFLEYEGTTIPIKVAQEMKRTLQQYNRKAYGELSTHGKEFDKALAWGIREQLEQQIPQLGTVNKEMADRINLEQVLERAVHRIRNYDVIRMGDTIAATAGAAATQSGEGAGIGYIVKRTLEAPTVKARLGFLLDRANKAPATGRALSRGMGYVIGKALQDEEERQKDKPGE